jgi:hypothetical protein
VKAPIHFFRLASACFSPVSTLALLVLLVGANDEQHAFAPDDFAVTTDFLY